jgi:hypothetical protein
MRFFKILSFLSILLTTVLGGCASPMQPITLNKIKRGDPSLIIDKRGPIQVAEKSSVGPTIKEVRTKVDESKFVAKPAEILAAVMEDEFNSLKSSAPIELVSFTLASQPSTETRSVARSNTPVFVPAGTPIGAVIIGKIVGELMLNASNTTTMYSLFTDIVLKSGDFYFRGVESGQCAPKLCNNGAEQDVTNASRDALRKLSNFQPHLQVPIFEGTSLRGRPLIVLSEGQTKLSSFSQALASQNISNDKASTWYKFGDDEFGRKTFVRVKNGIANGVVNLTEGKTSDDPEETIQKYVERIADSRITKISSVSSDIFSPSKDTVAEAMLCIDVVQSRAEEFTLVLEPEQKFFSIISRHCKLTGRTEALYVTSLTVSTFSETSDIALAKIEGQKLFDYLWNSTQTDTAKKASN